MTVTLTPEQVRWIEAAVAAGQFPSVEEAVRMAVADLMAVEFSNVDWMRPYVDEARVDVARGEVVSGDEFLAWLDDRMKMPHSR